MCFEVNSFMTVISINNDQSKRPLFTFFMPLYLLAVALSPKSFNKVDESLDLLEFWLLIVICELHDSFINYPTFPEQNSPKVSKLIEWMEFVKIKNGFKLRLLILFSGQKLSISNGFDGHFD